MLEYNHVINGEKKKTQTKPKPTQTKIKVKVDNCLYLFTLSKLTSILSHHKKALPSGEAQPSENFLFAIKSVLKCVVTLENISQNISDSFQYVGFSRTIQHMSLSQYQQAVINVDTECYCIVGFMSN